MKRDAREHTLALSFEMRTYTEKERDPMYAATENEKRTHLGDKIEGFSPTRNALL